MMIRKTYFLVFSDESVLRQEVIKSNRIWQDMPMKLARDAELIIEVSEYGRGKAVKNRHSGKTVYYTKDEMVMFALRAENV